MSKAIPGRTPAPLLPGDIIRVISPAGPADEGNLALGIERLRNWGYEVEVSRHALDCEGFFAGSDDSRLNDLVDALLDPQVKGIICSRGGYGTARLLDRIPWKILTKAPPKPFIGFSDLGSLQANLWARAGWITYSGLQAAHGLGGDTPDWALNSFRYALDGNWSKASYLQDSREITLQPIRAGAAEGVLLPICLSILVSLLGTKFMPSLKRVILCIEDIAEPHYRIDRLFWQLGASEACEDLEGVILGAFLLNGGSLHELAASSALEHIGRQGVPIWTGMPYGHMNERVTLPVGALASVSESGKFCLRPSV